MYNKDLQDLKNIIIYNFKDIITIINTDFIIYWFIVSLIFFLLPLINALSLIILYLFLVLSLKYFINLLSIDNKLIEFFVNPAENLEMATRGIKLENIFKYSWREIKKILGYSITAFLFMNLPLIIVALLVYGLLGIIKINFFLKGLVIGLLLLLIFGLVLVYVIMYIIYPLILLKGLEAQNLQDFLNHLLYIWQDLYDENTLIFFRSLFFDLFWRLVVIFIISLPLIAFFILFYKLLIINFIFSLFFGWLFCCLIIGLFFTLFTIDLVKNYYIYFYYV